MAHKFLFSALFFSSLLVFSLGYDKVDDNPLNKLVTVPFNVFLDVLKLFGKFKENSLIGKSIVKLLKKSDDGKHPVTKKVANVLFNIFVSLPMLGLLGIGFAFGWVLIIAIQLVFNVVPSMLKRKSG